MLRKLSKPQSLGHEERGLPSPFTTGQEIQSSILLFLEIDHGQKAKEDGRHS